MRRRAFIASLAGASALGLGGSRPAVAVAQGAGPRVHRVNLLAAGNPRTAPQWVAFDLRLRELGYAEGRNIVTDFRDARGQIERFPEHAREIVGARPDLIVATGPEQLLRAIRDATRTIPVVMISVDFDPVSAGHVELLARPGGNMTGITFRQVELSAKRLELLKEALPAVGRISMFWDRFSADQLRSAIAAAGALGLSLHPVELEDVRYDLAGAFDAALANGSKAVLTALSPPIYRDRERLARFALDRRLPAFFPLKEFTEEGGLLSFGVNFPAQWRRAAEYVDRVLRGARPADLPIEQPTSFELVINLKTARALDVTIPLSILARADEVIE